MSCQGAIACLRSSQVSLGAVTLIAQGFLIEGSMHSHWQVANPIYFNAVGDTPQDELSGGFFFLVVNQKNQGDFLLHFIKNVHPLPFPPIMAGLLCHPPALHSSSHLLAV